MNIFYGEDASKASPDEFFVHFTQFVQAFKDAIAQNAKEVERNAKEEKKRKVGFYPQILGNRSEGCPKSRKKRGPETYRRGRKRDHG